MGKTAKNEILKSRAALLNNIAVGLLIAGVGIPYLSVLTAMLSNQPRQELTARLIFTFVLPTVIAALIAALIHNIAQAALERIED